MISNCYSIANYVPRQHKTEKKNTECCLIVVVKTSKATIFCAWMLSQWIVRLETSFEFRRNKLLHSSSLPRLYYTLLNKKLSLFRVIINPRIYGYTFCTQFHDLFVIMIDQSTNKLRNTRRTNEGRNDYGHVVAVRNRVLKTHYGNHAMYMFPTLHCRHTVRLCL